MNDIINKISPYKLFNYLLPGILFVYLAKYFTDYNFIQENNFIGAFLYYFFGMAISRIGSLLVEPFLEGISFVTISHYKRYVIASKEDNILELLLEVSNTYRTVAALFIVLPLLKLYKYLQLIWNIPNDITLLILSTFMLLLFIFSYRKQNNYVNKRIETDISTTNATLSTKH